MRLAEVLSQHTQQALRPGRWIVDSIPACMSLDPVRQFDRTHSDLRSPCCGLLSDLSAGMAPRNGIQALGAERKGDVPQVYERALCQGSCECRQYISYSQLGDYLIDELRISFL